MVDKSLRVPAIRVNSRAEGAMSQVTVIRFGALGDTLMLTPIFRYLHRLTGRPVNYLGRSPWTRQILGEQALIDNCAQIGSKRVPIAMSAEKRLALDWLRSNACDLVLDLESDRVSGALLDGAGIPKQRVIRSQDVSCRRGLKHQVNTTLGRARMALEERDDVTELDPSLSVRVPDAWHADAQAWLLARGWRASDLILVAPGNKRTMSWRPHWRRSNRKHWPLRDWARLCATLLAADPSSRILVTGAPAEQRLARIIARQAGSSRVHAVADDMPTTRMMALMCRARGAITLDSGPAHAAAAVDCPLITLFNATDPKRFLPLSPSGRVRIVTPGDRSPADWVAGSIGVEQVARAWLELQSGASLAPTVSAVA